ncbi:hypothetical protein LguiB_017742 [Lonicera macranthoides]
MASNFDPFLAKALSFREALSWAKSQGISNVCFESDSSLLISVIRCNLEDPSYVRMIIKECKILTQDLVNCSFNFVHRSTNQVAPKLAQAAGSSFDSRHWEFVPPSFILNLLAVDSST